MRYLSERVMRACIFALFATMFGVLGTKGPSAQEVREQPNAVQLIQFLQNNPENRRARWALSQMAFKAGRYDIAGYHVQHLLQISSSQQDIDTLTRALAAITTADPWNVELSFALLPSSNIRRYTYNDEFETVLGIFTPIGGGKEESGIGISVGAGLSYALSLPDNSRLTLRASVDHNLYDTSDLNQTHLLFAARHDFFSLGHSTTIEPYLSFRFDEGLILDRRKIGLNLSRNWWLEEGAQFRASAVIENRDYLVDEVLSGPYGRVSLRYSYALNDQLRLGFGFALARSEPQRVHLKYWEGQMSVDASRRFENVGVFGLFSRYTERRYDNIFPATTLIREDKTFTLGVSYQHNSFEILGSRPKISCQVERNSSNIALYDYKATDCGLTFERSF